MDEAEELARRAALFREGAKRFYEDKSKSTNGDMWFFELYHFLDDCADALLRKSATSPDDMVHGVRYNMNADK